MYLKRCLGTFPGSNNNLLLRHISNITGSVKTRNRSLTKGCKTVGQHALRLACGLRRGKARLTEALGDIADCLSAGCTMTTRKKHPNNYQLLLLAPDTGLG